MRSEIIDNTDGDGLLEIRGRDFDTLLLVGGETVAINWNDCAGSVAQYLIRRGLPSVEPHFSPLTRYALEGNIDESMTLATQFGDLISLFVNGSYELRLGDPDTITETLALRSDWDANLKAWHVNSDIENFYPIDTTLVLTSPSFELDNDRVDYFEAAIRSGARPVMVAATAQDAWCSYVIDGHHKFAAYSRLGVRPTVLTVSRCEPTELSSDTIANYFGRDHPMAEDYASLKRRYDA